MPLISPRRARSDRELRDLGLADAEVALGLQVDAAGVLDVQRVELRRDFPPDALLLVRVVDARRPEVLQPVLAAEREQFLAARDVGRVPQPRMSRLELELGDIRRIGVDVVLGRGGRGAAWSMFPRGLGLESEAKLITSISLAFLQSAVLHPPVGACPQRFSRGARLGTASPHARYEDCPHQEHDPRKIVVSTALLDRSKRTHNAAPGPRPGAEGYPL